VSSPPVPDYVLQTAVVLDDVRLVYVPVPKAGSTAILWTLADLAGVSADDFVRSRKLEVTRALTVHDVSAWGPTHRLGERSAEEIEWMLRSDEWFRFTVVREPVRRVWSGWVSKVLFRNPRFAAVFGDAPPVVVSQDVLDAFRAFMYALPDRPEWHDRHWASQADLIDLGNVEYGHVGRVEDMDGTTALVAEHVASNGGSLPSLKHENPSFVPYSPGVFDERALEVCTEWTARDRDAFGYEPPSRASEPGEAWHAEVGAALPAIQLIIEQNERIGDLGRMLEDPSTAAEEEAGGRRIASALPAALRRRLRGRAADSL
jgi:hypothetical protein